MSREHWLHWRQRVRWLRQRVILQVRPDHRRAVRCILAVTLGLIAALSVAWPVATDIEDPPAPLNPNTLIDIFSTLADVAAALATLIGFFGLWRLDQMRQRVRAIQQRQLVLAREQWRCGTDWNTVCARAAARKKHNEARRHFMNQVIDEMVWPKLLKYGYEKWGTCSRIAREIGVHRSTVYRYRQRIFRELRGR